MAVERCRFFFRHKGVNNELVGLRQSDCNIPGLALCYKYGSKETQRACVKLVRKGSAFGGTGFFVRNNGLIFEASSESMYVGTNVVIDDCGKDYKVYLPNIRHTFDDGWYLGGTRYYCIVPEDDGNDYCSVDLTAPWTVAFKVKGSSATGSDGTGVIAVLSGNDYWIIGKKPALGDILFFCLRKNGQLFFRDYFQQTVFDGNLTDWRDFKITFYPTNTTEYNKSIKCDVQLVNFTAVCNGVTKNGSTYFTDFSSEDFLFKIGHATNYVSTADSTPENVGALNGYLKYFSVSQDTQGYSDYRRDTHKVALYFD